jgi:protein involved in polysaccharide export with SLBB domain
MRNINLKRDGSTLTSFDLYDVLLRGDTSTDRALQDGDVLYIPAIGPQVAIFGDVKKSSIYELKQKTSVADLVVWAGGFESAADLTKVIVQKNRSSRYETVAELTADWSAIRESLFSIPIAPTDIVRVVAPSSVALEVKIEREFVRVDGEVKRNGVYELKAGETLRGLLKRIGGVTGQGYVYGTKLTRESVRKEQQEKIDEAVDRYEQDIETSAKQRLSATADQAGMDEVVSAELDSQRRLVKKLRSVKSEGRIILNMSDANAGVDALPDIALMDGDKIYIPRRPMTVDVIGAVYQQNAFIFNDSRSVSNYLAIAGGVTPTGDRGEVYRICADGTVKSRRHSGGSNVSPGDAIVVPEKLQRGKSFTQSIKDWTTILYQFGLGAAGLNALK